jgi:hypothetical protein
MENQPLPLDPNTELLRWGPVQARYFFISDFILASESSYYSGENKPYKWAKGLLLFKGLTHLWINEYPQMWERGKRALVEVIMDDSKRSALREEYDISVKSLRGFEQKIISSDLNSCSLEALVDLFLEFDSKLIDFWAPALIPEIANYGSIKYFESVLKKEGFSVEDSSTIKQVLTAPEELSFFKKEEIDLIQTSNIKAHRDKYFWIKNSYGAVFDLGEEFFSERKSKLNKNIVLESKLFIEETKQRKKELIKNYSLSKEIVRIGEMIALCINWQDERKAVIEEYLHFKKILLDETAKRLGVLADDLLNFSSTELISMLEGKTNTSILSSRRGGFNRSFRDNSSSVLR